MEEAGRGKGAVLATGANSTEAFTSYSLTIFTSPDGFCQVNARNRLP
jgi:hypothetical protein